MTHFATLSIAQALEIIEISIPADVNPLFIGSPGIGKTAIARLAAERLGVKLITIIGSQCDSVDIGGWPVMVDGVFTRIPMAALKEAMAEGCIVFFDEITSVPKPVEAAIQRVVNEKIAGDSPLHPDTRFLAACNPPDQCPSGSDLSASTVNRFTIYEFQPTIDEVVSHFGGTIGADDSKAPHAAWARDFAATLAAKPDLVQMDPPEASINEAAPWSSPRACEAAFRMLAAIDDRTYATETEKHGAQFRAISGAMGKHAAQSYLAIRKLRADLPTIAEIVKDPKKAIVPDKRDIQIGALGLLQEVARKDVHAAWIYAGRLHAEVAQAAAKGLYPRGVRGKSPHAKDGAKARAKLVGTIGNRLTA
jgi:hypothetical protein